MVNYELMNYTLIYSNNISGAGAYLLPLNNYQKIIYEADKEKIRKDLEEGKELKFAYLEERGKHVVIR